MSEQSVSEHLRAHLLADELYRSEWSPEFERLQRNRLVLGALRYGRLHDKHQPKRDYIEDIIRRALAYRETGNLECLVDIANLAMVEFVRPSHLNPVWMPADDGQHAAEAATDEAVAK